MKLVNSVLIAFSVATTLLAGELDTATRKVLLDHLDQSSTDFHAALKGVTAEQWNYKPAPDVWSVAECAEHIVLTEDLLRDMVANKVLATPASPERIAARKLNDDKVTKMITDRSNKAKAPEVLKPTHQFATPEAALKAFDEKRAKTIAFAKSHDDLREHASAHPLFKELDAYQWLLYLSGHSMRHTAQILEVKASPGYPK
jgi:DinB superfamily